MNIGREEDSREDQQSNNWTDVCVFFFFVRTRFFFFLKIPLKAGGCERNLERRNCNDVTI